MRMRLTAVQSDFTLARLFEALVKSMLSRRHVLRLTVLGGSAALLQACAPAAPTTPTAAPAKPTAAAAAPTTAPAAPKPTTAPAAAPTTAPAVAATTAPA